MKGRFIMRKNKAVVEGKGVQILCYYRPYLSQLIYTLENLFLINYVT
jgi:hypothetical protein